jgi:hypothetical protein
MEVLNSLGALGFWIFIAAVVVAGIWFDARKREIQQETLRRIVESGKEIDTAMLDKLIAAGRSDSNPAQELKTGGVIMISIAPGLAVLGWFMSGLSEPLLKILLGVAFVVLFIGVGMMVASKVSERGHPKNKG